MHIYASQKIVFVTYQESKRTGNIFNFNTKGSTSVEKTSFHPTNIPQKSFFWKGVFLKMPTIFFVRSIETISILRLNEKYEKYEKHLKNMYTSSICPGREIVGD